MKNDLNGNRRKNKKSDIGGTGIDTENKLHCFVGRTRKKRI